MHVLLHQDNVPMWQYEVSFVTYYNTIGLKDQTSLQYSASIVFLSLHKNENKTKM